MNDRILSTMKITRRSFIAKGIGLGLVTPFMGQGLWSCGSQESSNKDAEQSKKLKILILGGTSFLGPHQVAYALSRGHEVSTFTRGKTQPSIYTELFDQVQPLIGDREDNLKALEEGSWDLVIDNSGRKAKWTRDSANLLKDRAGLYLYTSSTGVFYPYLGDNLTENTELLMEVPTGPEYEQFDLEYDYGVMKANSELEAVKAFGENRTIVVRPTYMLGPADRTNRFAYWPVRLAKGGDILVPGKAEDPVQYIDVRDVAEWMIRLGEEKMTGTFNAAGPETAQTMPEFVRLATQAFDVESNLVQIDDYEFLKENNVRYMVPWIMPEGNNYGSARVNNQKAIQAGLSFRDLKVSIRDTYDWWYSEAVEEQRRHDLESGEHSMMKRESEIIQKWRTANV